MIIIFHLSKIKVSIDLSHIHIKIFTDFSRIEIISTNLSRIKILFIDFSGIKLLACSLIHSFDSIKQLLFVFFIPKKSNSTLQLN
jgi:hypothetical protein